MKPICSALQIAPSTYCAVKRLETDPSARAVGDAVMTPILLALWINNRNVYGAHKLLKAARRTGHEIGRDQVGRLKRELGIEGIIRRRKRVFTAVSDRDAMRAPDLVNRDFTAAVADGPDVCPDTQRDSERVFHRRRLQSLRRRVAGRVEHAHRCGPRCPRDGTTVPRPAAARRTRGSCRCGVAIHVRAVHRTPHRDGCSTLDRDGGGFLRRRACGDDQRPLQDRLRLRAQRSPPIGGHRGTRAPYPLLRALIQRAPAAQPLRRRATSRLRSSVLPCPTDRPHQSLDQTARAPN